MTPLCCFAGFAYPAEANNHFLQQAEEQGASVRLSEVANDFKQDPGASGAISGATILKACSRQLEKLHFYPGPTSDCVDPAHKLQAENFSAHPDTTALWMSIVALRNLPDAPPCWFSQPGAARLCVSAGLNGDEKQMRRHCHVST